MSKLPVTEIHKGMLVFDSASNPIFIEDVLTLSGYSAFVGVFVESGMKDIIYNTTPLFSKPHVNNEYLQMSEICSYLDNKFAFGRIPDGITLDKLLKIKELLDE